MRAIIITVVVVVLILAIGIPVIHYATKADKATISSKTLVTGKTVENIPDEAAPGPEEEVQDPVQTAEEPDDEELSAKEMLEQYKSQEQSTAESGSKVGYTVDYLIEQSKTQQQATCQPLLDSAEQAVEDAELDAEAKQKIYDNKRDDLRELIDDGADEDDINDARDELEEAKKAYEDALAAKYTAQDELVQVRVQCASYLT